MEKRAIAAFLIGCKGENMLAFKDYGEEGVAAIGPDGKKYIYSPADLDHGETLLRDAELSKADQAREEKEAEAEASKPAKPATRRQATRKKTTTKKKATK